MAEKARFWAGKAVSAGQFAASYGRLDDVNPLSIVVLFKAGGSVEWGYVDLPRTIVSIAHQSMPPDDAAMFLAMSNEGDVYRIEDDIPHEKIPGAGVLSDDALGLGSMRTLSAVGRELVAVGTGSQAYIRHRDGGWERLFEPASILPLKIDLSAAAERAPGALALAGATQLTYREPTKEEEETLARIRREGPNSRYLQARREVRRIIRYVEGSLSVTESSRLREFDISSPHALNDVVCLEGGQIVAAGDAGTIFLCNPNEDVVDISISGVTEKFTTIRRLGARLFLLGETSIYVLGPELDFQESIALPPKPKFPFSFDIGHDWIVLFAHDGIAIRDTGSWLVVQVPASILERVNLGQT